MFSIFNGVFFPRELTIYDSFLLARSSNLLNQANFRQRIIWWLNRQVLNWSIIWLILFLEFFRMNNLIWGLKLFHDASMWQTCHYGYLKVCHQISHRILKDNKFYGFLSALFLFYLFKIIFFSYIYSFISQISQVRWFHVGLISQFPDVRVSSLADLSFKNPSEVGKSTVLQTSSENLLSRFEANRND